MCKQPPFGYQLPSPPAPDPLLDIARTGPQNSNQKASHAISMHAYNDALTALHRVTYWLIWVWLLEDGHSGEPLKEFLYINRHTTNTCTHIRKNNIQPRSIPHCTMPRPLLPLESLPHFVNTTGAHADTADSRQQTAGSRQQQHVCRS